MLLLETQAGAGQAAATLTALQEQEVSLTVQLADANRQLREAEMRYGKEMQSGNTGGAQQDATRSLLSQAESRVVLTQQRLNNVRDRIGQIQHDIAISTMGPRASSVADGSPRNGIFGISAAEFGGGLTLLFAFPIVLGLSRWIWRRTAPRALPENVLEGNPQFARLEQAVEAIAIEVERIGEAQRYSAKLLGERPVEAQAERAAQAPRSRRPVITPLP